MQWRTRQLDTPRRQASASHPFAHARSCEKTMLARDFLSLINFERL
jgi:hypothetical protein